MSAQYRRARTDYPTGVLAIYDNPRETDRYTVVYTPEIILGELWFTYALIDGDGMGCHGQARNYDRPRSSWGQPSGMGAGKVIAFEALPAEAQAYVARDLSDWGAPSDEADDMLAAIQHN